MSMHEMVYRLKPSRLIVLKETLSSAAVAHEIGGNPREVFRRAKHAACVGIEKKLYTQLEAADSKQLDALSNVVCKEF